MMGRGAMTIQDILLHDELVTQTQELRQPVLVGPIPTPWRRGFQPGKKLDCRRGDSA
jgi:hypothetical protein